MADYEIFELGEVRLQMGETLRDAKLAYRTYGSLNQAKSNAIVYPTWYSGQHYDAEWLIGEGMALDQHATASSCPTCSATVVLLPR
jgi:homoserine O-acetyltransferase